MRYISDFFATLIMVEVFLVNTLLGATAAQLHFLGPLLMFGIFWGAPIYAAISSVSKD